MKTKLMVIGTACMMIATCKPAADPDKIDREKLQGAWIVVSADTDGYLPWIEVAARDGELVFSGDKAIFKNEHETQMVYRIDPRSNPKAMDITCDKKEALKAIYTIDRDILKLCFGSSSRPTEFVAKPGHDGQALLVLKRSGKP